MAPRVEEYAGLFRRVLIFAAVALICAVPGLLYWLGLCFDWDEVDYEGTFVDEEIVEPSLQMLQGLLRGSTAYTLLEWTVVCLALSTAVLAFAKYNIKRDKTAPIISMAAFWAGTIAGFQLMAFHGFGLDVASTTEFVHFNWTLSQTFSGLLFLWAAGYVLWKGGDKELFHIRHLLILALVFSLVAYAIILITSRAPELPVVIHPEAVIKRPADLLPLGLFLIAAVVVFPLLHRMCQTVFSMALWVSSVAFVASQIYVVFFSTGLFDAGFTAAQLAKAAAFSIIFAGLVWDYSKTCHEEVKLRRSLSLTHRRVGRLVENALEIIIIFDTSWRVILWNPQAEKTFGWSAQEAEGRNLLELIFGGEENGDGPAVELQGLIKRVIDEGDQEELQKFRQTVICNREKEEIPVEYSLIPTKGHQGDLNFAFMARDVTDRERLQLRMIEMDRLVAAGTLAAGVVHEINNPLSYVVTNIEVCKEMLERVGKEIDSLPEGKKGGPEGDVVKSGERLRAYVEEVVSAMRAAGEGAERVRRIATDMRVFSHIKADEPGPFPVRDALDVALHMTTGEARRRARIEVEVLDDPLVRADRTRISQVFVNLILNGLQAMEEVDREEHMLRIQLADDGEMATIAFEDTGKGMSRGLMKRIFTPFFTTKPAGQGTGLGLSLSRSIVEEFGGTIEVESSPDKGSVFVVKLPIVRNQ